MFSKLRESMSIRSKTPKSTPPASAPASRPSSPIRPSGRSSISSTSTPLSSRRASLSENNNNFPGTNAQWPPRNNFAALSPTLPKNNFPGTASKSSPRNNFFGADTESSNGFSMMDPQGTRNNFPGDN